MWKNLIIQNRKNSSALSRVVIFYRWGCLVLSLCLSHNIVNHIVQLNQLICFIYFSSVLPNSLWSTSVLTFAFLCKKIMVQWTLSKPLLYLYLYLFIVLHRQTAVLEKSLYIIIHFFHYYYYLFVFSGKLRHVTSKEIKVPQWGVGKKEKKICIT